MTDFPFRPQEIHSQAEQDSTIQLTIDYIRKTLEGAEGGHDWWHIFRVWKMAQRIAETEAADPLVVQLGALLHDIADVKFNDGDEKAGPRMAGEFLVSIGVADETIEHVQRIIENISFKGGKEVRQFRSAELDIVQDADRLDALGAIGIARTFNYGGYRNREIYNPGIKPDLHMNKEAYYSSKAPTLNHFYEKLLLLKDRMNTSTGRKMAQHRHDFMLKYLDEFYSEWEGII
ncbi:MAG: uncharacterized protein FD166_2179 [Bacteroidetes bacterium]|nr:MAG: uncharacterized protein FD166_2179 [Bacteroidota bacterium]